MTLQKCPEKHRLKSVLDECNKTIIAEKFDQILAYDHTCCRRSTWAEEADLAAIRREARLWFARFALGGDQHTAVAICRLRPIREQES